MRSKTDLRQLQALPLEIKIRMSKRRIRDWVREYGESGVYVSFSGGKDSTVLLHMVREDFPDVEAVFVNTGLEYPEIQQFVKSFDNVTIVRPKMRFDEVIKKYGYPLISKNVSHQVKIARNSPNGNVAQNIFNLNTKGKYALYRYNALRYTDFEICDRCCDIMKKDPAKKYQKETSKVPFLATMACESTLREDAWIKNGCNAFNIRNPHSAPMSFWTEDDVLQYIKKYNLPIASVYGEIVYENEPDQVRFEEIGGKEKLKTTGCNRTGCIFCAFGAHLEKKPNRFEMLKQTHPRQYDYCINGGEFNEDGIWQPNKDGLGMGYVFDELNKLYGEDFIKYK
jgi:3'-phosphoadenosine 5'-phosphosulfate sulfotransferase (PAPS reductase)/FAD synthetase